MKKNNNDFKTVLYKDIMPKVYGIGAAIVIAGAMFKLLNWPGGALMLGLGLSTEAIIFILSAFEPEHKEPEWERVYPELADDYNGEPVSRGRSGGIDTEKILESINLDPAVIENLSKNLSTLSETVKSMALLSAAAVATDEYVQNITKASKVLGELNNLYSSTLGSGKITQEIAQNADDYNKSLMHATESINALTNVYANELKVASDRYSNLTNLYEGVYSSVEVLKDSSNDVNEFKLKLKQLKDSIGALSDIYESMLSSIKTKQ